MDKSSIIEQLEEFLAEVRDYTQNVFKHMSSCIDRELKGERTDFFCECKDFDELDFLVKNKIAPFIMNNEILNKEFWEKTNYYYKLNIDKDYQQLINELYENINTLYGFVDLKTALGIENKRNEKEDYNHFYISCENAIKSLNINHESENGINNSNYTQFINLIKDKNNYYSLTLEKFCGVECEEILVTNDDILNKYEIITQYEALEKPLNSRITGLFNNIFEFEALKKQYDSNVDKLKMLLKGNIEEENLNYFYIFNRFMRCSDLHKPCYEGDYMNCMHCVESTEIVLKELINYIKNEAYTKLRHKGFILDTKTGKAYKNGEHLKTFTKNSKRFKLILNMLSNEGKKMNIYDLAETIGYECKTAYEKEKIKDKILNLKKNVLADIQNAFNIKVNTEDIFIED